MALTQAQEKLLQRIHLGQDNKIGPDLKNARVLMHIGYATIWEDTLKLTEAGKRRVAKIRTGESK